MPISPKKKKLLCEYVNYCCEGCDKECSIEGLEIHRIRSGDEGGTYEHRNCKVLCKDCHELHSAAQRMTRGISS